MSSLSILNIVQSPYKTLLWSKMSNSLSIFFRFLLHNKMQRELSKVFHECEINYYELNNENINKKKKECEDEKNITKILFRKWISIFVCGNAKWDCIIFIVIHEKRINFYVRRNWVYDTLTPLTRITIQTELKIIHLCWTILIFYLRIFYIKISILVVVKNVWFTILLAYHWQRFIRMKRKTKFFTHRNSIYRFKRLRK